MAKKRFSKSKAQCDTNEVKEDYTSIPNAKGRKFGDSYVGKRNDLSWYTVNEQVLKDVARIPYAIPTGTIIHDNGKLMGTELTKGDATYDNSVPGIVTMEIVPTVGNAKEAMDPVNAAANGQYTALKSGISGSVRFEQNDVMIYNISVDSVYYYMAWLTRLYSSLPMYHQATRYVPRTLVECQGVDYDDLLENSARFRAEINKRAPLIKNLRIPKALYIFPRHKWLFENYFIEGETEKAQLYMFRPAAVYIYQLDSNGAGMAKCHRVLAGGSGQGGRLTVDDMIRKLDAMLNPIYDDEFFNIISGFMEKAYTDFLDVEPIPDQPILPIVYSPDVLLQFKNAKPTTVKHSTLDSGYEDGFFDVVQRINPGSNVRLHLETLTPKTALNVFREMPSSIAINVDGTSTTNTQNCLQGIYNEWSKDTLLTSPHADVTPGENMINTRLTLAFEYSYDSNEVGHAKIDKMYFGSEWPIEIQVWQRRQKLSTGEIESVNGFTLNHVMLVDLTATNLQMVFNRRWPCLSKFKYLPELILVSNDGTDTFTASESIFELDNYTLIDARTLGMMHDAALLAEFRLPEIALMKGHNS